MRIIDADALLKPMKLQKEALGKIAPKAVVKWYDYAIWEIQQAPTIDAEPVKRGKWLTCEDGWGDVHYQCSECGQVRAGDTEGAMRGLDKILRRRKAKDGA